MDTLYKSLEQVQQDLENELAMIHADAILCDALPDVQYLELDQLPDLVLE